MPGTDSVQSMLGKRSKSYDFCVIWIHNQKSLQQHHIMKLWLAVLEDSFWLIAILFGILSAYQKWQDVRQTKREKKRVKESYYRFWLKLRNTGILDLPKLGIRWFLQLESRFSQYFERIFFFFLNKDYHQKESKTHKGIGSYLTYVLIGFFVKYGWVFTLVALLPLIWMVLFLRFHHKLKEGRQFLLIYVLTTLVFVSMSLWGTFLCLEAALTLSANSFGDYALFAIFLVAIPLLGIHFKDMLGWLLSLLNLSLSEKVANPYVVFNFAYAAALSLVVTTLAFLIGKVSEPDAVGIYSVQFYLSNMLFDALTLTATFFILKRALASEKGWVLLLGILLDLLLATIFAFLSCTSELPLVRVRSAFRKFCTYFLANIRRA